MQADWQPIYLDRMTSAAEAVGVVRSGNRILVGSGCAAPSHLLDALVARAAELSHVEIVHLLTFGVAPYVQERYQSAFRHNAFFIGANVRGAVQEGRADYTPIFLSEIPQLFASGQMPLDVALIMVSPPNRFGYCSVGIHPDIVMSGVDHARVVVAQVNRYMPRVAGDTYIHISDIDHFVEHEAPLEELEPPEPNDMSMAIARNVASLVTDGSTLQLGIGRIPDAVLSRLAEHNDLGLHSEMFSDGIIDLCEAGVITNAKKGFCDGKAIASFAMGTARLYNFLDENPFFEFHRTEFVNDPRNIARNNKMISINGALEVDLTGQVCADSRAGRFYSGIGGQVDFIRGAAMSHGGKPIIAMPSTAKGGEVSRIVPILSPGAGVVTSRGDVHYVVTEYGAAYLHGKTIRHRAAALIDIAHPDHRAELRAQAADRKYFPLPPDWREQAVPEHRDDPLLKISGVIYAVRPLVPEDADKLRGFFDRHDRDTVQQRFRCAKKSLTHDEALHLCSVDQRWHVALGVFDDDQRICAIGRYVGDRKTGLVEIALVVAEDLRIKGLGTMLWRALVRRAREIGYKGATGAFALGNAGAMTLHRRLGHVLHVEDGECRYTVMFEDLDAIERDAVPKENDGTRSSDEELVPSP